MGGWGVSTTFRHIPGSEQKERSLFRRAFFLSDKLEEEVAAGPPRTGGAESRGRQG